MGGKLFVMQIVSTRRLDRVHYRVEEHFILGIGAFVRMTGKSQVCVHLLTELAKYTKREGT